MPALAARVQQMEADQRREVLAQGQREQEAAREARELECLRNSSPGGPAPAELQERVLRATRRAEEIERGAGLLQRRSTELREARQRLVAACDGLLGGQLDAAQRVEVLRLRAAQVQAVASLEREAPPEQHALRERAGLLRDSLERVRRELLRLGQRAGQIERRQHLRERAAAVDEDLFAEQVSSRHRDARDSRETAQPAPAADTPQAGPGRDVGGGANGGLPAVQQALPPPPRGGPDPATLDLIHSSFRSGGQSRQRSGGSTPEERLVQVRRAQEDLRKLAEELSAHAARLEHQASESRGRP